MTALPTPPPPPASRRPWALSELLAWAFILLTVAAVVVIVFDRKRQAAAAPPDADDPQMELLLLSRYGIGVQHLITSMPPGVAPGAPADAASTIEQLLAQADRAAKTPADRLRTAILRGELHSKEEALQHLDSLAEVYPALRPDASAFRALYDPPTTAPATLPESPASAPDITPLPTLRTRYGWFVDLAQSNGKPNTDPQRAAMLAAAQRTVVSLVGVSVIGLGGGFVGLILLIIAIVLLRIGRIKTKFAAAPIAAALPKDRRTYVQAFAIYLLGMMFLSFLVLALHLVNQQFELSRVFARAFAPVAFLSALCWPLLRKQSFAQWRAALGLHANGRGPAGVLREIFAGLLGYLTGLPVFIAGVLLTILFTKLSNADTSHPITKELASAPNAWVTVLLLASVFAPITEELMFRGALFAHLRERFGWWTAAPVVALIFASVHPQGWAAIPALASLAIVFAGIREWRGSIVGCIAAHALHNTLTLLFVLLMLS